MEIETIKVKHKDGFKIINKDDFNPREHEVFGAKKPTGRKPKKYVVKNAD